MTTGTGATAWEIDPNADDATALAALNDDRRWTAYAIADLSPAFRPFSQVGVARAAGGRQAACLVMRHPAFNAIVTHGDSDGLAGLLGAMGLPDQSHIQFRDEHAAAIERRYAFPTGRRQMLRMFVDAGGFVPPLRGDSLPVRLLPADLPVMHELYALYDGGVFSAYQVHDGVFYGVRDGDRLLAAGGTHIIAPRESVAAIGNIFTRSEVRGRGLATAVTGAIAADLLALPCRDVILSVATDNAPAIAAYRRLGFKLHCTLWEANVELLSAPG